ncbi:MULTISPECIES: ATP synthase subunit I [Clostridium]|uniref:ATP synthase subunit I n=1 Tax=Clostridium TaxID=1485 RepID=UPI00082659EB|nr:MULTISPECIES: ATP synthase subunit I [Clostridium]PJI09151.1 hypothetical protein CUB90_15270 [Clostridium sp. CT7]
MNQDIKKMLKIVTICDILVAILVFAVLFININNYVISLIAVLGIFTAVLNFYLSTVTANFVLINKSSNKSLIVFSSIFRVVLVCAISIILYKIYKYYLIAYIGGYSAHFIALIIYGLLLKNNSGRE